MGPQELGLPKKFKAWRNGQEEVIKEAASCAKYAYLLDAPTGVGKSIIGIAIHKLTGKQCVYITRTKQLQNQIMLEFPGIAVQLKGRNNYPCALYPKLTAEDCPGKCNKICAYQTAKLKAIMSPLVVLNVSYYLHEANGPSAFSGRKLLIIDEVDSIESELMNFIQFSVSQRALTRLKIRPPDNPQDRQSWLVWGDNIVPELTAMIGKLDLQLVRHPWSDVEIGLNKQMQQLIRFRNKVRYFMKEFNEAWTFSFIEDFFKRGIGQAVMSRLTGSYWQAVFKPVLVSEYADKYLWQHTEQVIGMSGTILNPDIMTRDIKLADWDYKKLPSPFPVANRPIYYDPVVNLTMATMDRELPILRQRVRQLIDQYPNDKVLVHTTSYKIRDYLLGNLGTFRLITHEQEDRDEQLEEFKRSREPLVMLSPSFDRGVDLPNESCRCIIVCKVPYPYLGDKQIKARTELPGGNQWYSFKAIQTIIQMTGRGVRSNNDYCDSWILDRQFGRLLIKMINNFPQWWLDALKRVKEENSLEGVDLRGNN